MIDVIAILARAVALASIIVMAGAVTFHWAVLRRWQAPPAALRRTWEEVVARSGARAAVCLLLVAPARVYLQARSLVVAGDPVLPMMGNVLQTTWGSGWLFQVVATLNLFIGFSLARRAEARGWRLAVASAACATLSPALMGHAIAAERLVVLSVLTDWVHVAMAGGWVGALGMLALLSHSRDAGGPEAPIASLIELFHPVAFTCSAALVGTGVISLLLRVPHLADLLHSPYGAVLGIKLTLTLGLAALGLHHARRGAQLVRRGETRRVAKSLAVEAMVAALVIGATAVLVGTSPPM
ncbi:MAG TPA: CopD family protein [Gemmatimonadaceae bacterium]|jgi:putative copper export protein